MKPKMYRSYIAIFVAIISLLFYGCIRVVRMPENTMDFSVITPPPPTLQVTHEPIDYARPFTQYIGNREDKITVMLYLCGSDLESSYGSATADLNEILSADIGPNIDIVIETGGAEQWQNSTISNETNQRYLFNSDGFTLIEDNMGQKDMTSPETLGDFIKYCNTNYPANRNILILWDHGGGSVSGYGYDELFDYYDYDSMTLDEIKYALELGEAKFEFIGFDACLMSTVETGYVLKDFADYMLASQKMEPGSGWYYTDWINNLSKNPSMPAQELASYIIDDYIVNAVNEAYTVEATLAFVDLSKIEGLFAQILEYYSAADKTLAEGGFAEVSMARANAASGTRGRDIQTDYDHVDLVALARNLKNSESDKLIAAVEESIVYFNYGNATDVCGLNIYFPYTDLSYFDSVVNMYQQIGMDQRYIQFLSNFISVMVGGQIGASDSVITDPNNNYSAEDWSSYDWYDDQLVSSYEGYYEQTSGYYYDLLVTEKDGGYVLSLTDEEWETVTSIELQTYLDDGQGYIYLGCDNVYEFDEDGDLLITFDNTWVSVNGQTVAFYAEEEQITEDGFWYTYGSSPAYLNDEFVDIIIMWDDNNPYGYTVGARYYYEGAISQKGYVPLQDGDVIEFLCEYYSYDGSYEDYYYFNEPITYYSEPEISYEDIGYGDCIVYYMLTDIYGNHYWTEQVLFYD